MLEPEDLANIDRDIRRYRRGGKWATIATMVMMGFTAVIMGWLGNGAAAFAYATVVVLAGMYGWVNSLSWRTNDYLREQLRITRERSGG